jgi:ribonuclease VapC
LIVVDTSALVAILRQEPERDQFLRTIVASQDARIGAPTAFEYRMVATGTRSTHGMEQVERILVLRYMRVVEWTPADSLVAQAAFLKYGKGRHPAKLNFGDCMSYALAKSLDCPLLYKGGDFALTDIKSAAAVPQ